MRGTLRRGLLWLLAVFAISAGGAGAQVFDQATVMAAAEAASSGDRAGAEAKAKAALEACSGKDEAVCLLQTQLILARTFGLVGAWDLAEAHAERGVGLAKKRNDALTLLTAQVLHATSAAHAGQLEKANAIIAQGRRSAAEADEGLGETETRGVSLQNMLEGAHGVLLFKQGRIDEAVRAQQRFIEITEVFQAGNPGLVTEWITLGSYQEEAGELAGAEASYRHAIKLAREMNHPQAVADAEKALGDLRGRR